MFGLLIVPMVVGSMEYVRRQQRANMKPPDPPKPPVRKRVVPDDYKDRINAFFKKMQQEVEEYGDGAPPDYIVERLCMRISREVEAFPIIDDPKKWVPDDFEVLISSDFAKTYMAAAKNPNVNLNLIIQHLHEDLIFLVGKWK